MEKSFMKGEQVKVRQTDECAWKTARYLKYLDNRELPHCVMLDSSQSDTQAPTAWAQCKSTL